MLELFLENRASVQKLLLLVVVVLAFWKGKGPERACASVLVGMVLFQIASRDLVGLPSSFLALNPVGFIIDTGGLVAFVAIGLKANRFYPLVLASAQLVAFMSHLVRIMVEPVSSLAYYLLYAMPFWFQIFVLAGGIAHHMYRVSYLGCYPEWRLVPPPAPRTSFS